MQPTAERDNLIKYCPSIVKYVIEYWPLMIYVDNKALTYNNNVENVKLKK